MSDQEVNSTKSSIIPAGLVLPQPVGRAPLKLSLSRFKIVKSIGSGAFGVALLVTDEDDDKFVVKRIDISAMDEKARRAALGEVHVLSRLNHPNICTYYGSWIEGDPPFLYILLEYCDGGDLSQMIKQRKDGKEYFSESEIMNMFCQLSSAIIFCHKRAILHRDLKASNIFLSGPSRVIKLADFGISKMLNDGSLASTVIGTPYYMSPELVNNEPYSYQSDIWSLGCVLYEMCTLKHAFDANNMCALVLSILRGKYPPLPDIYSSDLAELVDSMLQIEPGMRPSMDDILSMKIVQDSLLKAAKKEDSQGRKHFQRAQTSMATVSGSSSAVAPKQRRIAMEDDGPSSADHTQSGTGLVVPSTGASASDPGLVFLSKARDSLSHQMSTDTDESASNVSDYYEEEAEVYTDADADNSSEEGISQYESNRSGYHKDSNISRGSYHDVASGRTYRRSHVESISQKHFSAIPPSPRSIMLLPPPPPARKQDTAPMPEQSLPANIPSSSKLPPSSLKVSTPSSKLQISDPIVLHQLNTFSTASPPNISSSGFPSSISPIPQSGSPVVINKAPKYVKGLSSNLGTVQKASRSSPTNVPMPTIQHISPNMIPSLTDSQNSSHLVNSPSPRIQIARNLPSTSAAAVAYSISPLVSTPQSRQQMVVATTSSSGSGNVAASPSGFSVSSPTSRFRTPVASNMSAGPITSSPRSRAAASNFSKSTGKGIEGGKLKKDKKMKVLTDIPLSLSVIGSPAPTMARSTPRQRPGTPGSTPVNVSKMFPSPTTTRNDTSRRSTSSASSNSEKAVNPLPSPLIDSSLPQNSKREPVVERSKSNRIECALNSIISSAKNDVSFASGSKRSHRPEVNLSRDSVDLSEDVGRSEEEAVVEEVDSPEHSDRVPVSTVSSRSHRSGLSIAVDTMDAGRILGYLANRVPEGVVVAAETDSGGDEGEIHDSSSDLDLARSGKGNDISTGNDSDSGYRDYSYMRRARKGVGSLTLEAAEHARLLLRAAAMEPLDFFSTDLHRPRLKSTASSPGGVVTGDEGEKHLEDTDGTPNTEIVSREWGPIGRNARARRGIAALGFVSPTLASTASSSVAASTLSSALPVPTLAETLPARRRAVLTDVESKKAQFSSSLAHSPRFSSQPTPSKARSVLSVRSPPYKNSPVDVEIAKRVKDASSKIKSTVVQSEDGSEDSSSQRRFFDYPMTVSSQDFNGIASTSTNTDESFNKSTNKNREGHPAVLGRLHSSTRTPFTAATSVSASPPSDSAQLQPQSRVGASRSRKVLVSESEAESDTSNSATGLNIEPVIVASTSTAVEPATVPLRAAEPMHRVNGAVNIVAVSSQSGRRVNVLPTVKSEEGDAADSVFSGGSASASTTSKYPGGFPVDSAGKTADVTEVVANENSVPFNRHRRVKTSEELLMQVRELQAVMSSAPDYTESPGQQQLESASETKEEPFGVSVELSTSAPLPEPHGSESPSRIIIEKVIPTVGVESEDETKNKGYDSDYPSSLTSAATSQTEQYFRALNFRPLVFDSRSFCSLNTSQECTPRDIQSGSSDQPRMSGLDRNQYGESAVGGKVEKAGEGSGKKEDTNGKGAHEANTVGIWGSSFPSPNKSYSRPPKAQSVPPLALPESNSISPNKDSNTNSAGLPLSSPGLGKSVDTGALVGSVSGLKSVGSRATVLPSGKSTSSEVGSNGNGNRHRSWGRAQKELEEAATHLEIAKNMREMLKLGHVDTKEIFSPETNQPGRGRRASTASVDSGSFEGMRDRPQAGVRSAERSLSSNVRPKSPARSGYTSASFSDSDTALNTKADATTAEGSNRLVELKRRDREKNSKGIFNYMRKNTAASDVSSLSNNVDNSSMIDIGDFSFSKDMDKSEDRQSVSNRSGGSENALIENIVGDGSQSNSELSYPEGAVSGRTNKSTSTEPNTTRLHTTSSSSRSNISNTLSNRSSPDRIVFPKKPTKSNLFTHPLTTSEKKSPGELEQKESILEQGRVQTEVNGDSKRADSLNAEAKIAARMEALRTQCTSMLGLSKYERTTAVLRRVMVQSDILDSPSLETSGNELDNEEYSKIVQEIGPHMVARIQLILAYEDSISNTN